MKDKEKIDADIEIVVGDNSDLNFSDVNDCVTTLRPKDKKISSKKVIIPKPQSEKKNN